MSNVDGSLERIRKVLTDVEHEAVSHTNEWADEHPDDGTGGTEADKGAYIFRQACARAFSEGRGTWRALAMDRLMAAFAERDRQGLRDGILDAAGLLVAWAAYLDGAPAKVEPWVVPHPTAARAG